MPRASEKKAAIITGASRGLGLELSKLLIKSGWEVFGISRTSDSWTSARKKIPSKKFHLSALDVSDENEVAEFFRWVRHNSSRIDLLVNAAGYGGSLAPVQDTSVSEFEKHLKQNLISAFLMCRTALPFLKKSKAPLVMNVSSMAGVRSVPKLAAYSASKFGVLALTEALAKENSEWLKVITVCPGGMNTEMRAALFGKEDAAKQQTPAFVAEKMFQIVDGNIPLPSASHIVIRHSKITQIIIPPNN